MYARALRRPLELRHSFFLFGPRGTGKTTWLKQRLPNALYFDLLDSGLYVDLLARPERLGELIPPAYDGWVVLDEIRPRGPLDRPEEAEGAGWETLLQQEVRAVNDYEGLGYALSYWRTTAGAEVDLVAYGERGLLAFEVKRTGRLRREDGAGLRQFARDYPPAKCFLLYGGDRREYQGGVEVWPLAEALRCLPSILAAGAGGG